MGCVGWDASGGEGRLGCVGWEPTWPLPNVKKHARHTFAVWACAAPGRQLGRVRWKASVGARRLGRACLVCA